MPVTFAKARRRWPPPLSAALLLPLVLAHVAAIDGGRLLPWDAPLTAQAFAHRSPGDVDAQPLPNHVAGNFEADECPTRRPAVLTNGPLLEIDVTKNDVVVRAKTTD